MTRGNSILCHIKRDFMLLVEPNITITVDYNRLQVMIDPLKQAHARWRETVLKIQMNCY